MSWTEIVMIIEGVAVLILSFNVAFLRNEVRRLRIRLHQMQGDDGETPYDDFE